MGYDRNDCWMTCGERDDKLAELGLEPLDSPLREPWRSIDTAPKDGTPILVCCDDDFLQRSYIKHQVVVFWCIKEPTVKGWEVVGGSMLGLEPKFWQPLQAPPKTTHNSK